MYRLQGKHNSTDENTVKETKSNWSLTKILLGMKWNRTIAVPSKEIKEKSGEEINQIE